jgi:DNA-binding transcriptional LysR family regulator
MQRHFDDLQLGSIELFCAAAEAGSFTAAATVVGVTPAAVSRSIARLEQRLGARLFVRTTRQIRLTDAGRLYFEQCRQALSQLVEAERELGGHQRVPAGTVRISMPTSYGHRRILPMLPAFHALYPQVRIDAHVSNRSIDFAAEGFDLAIRIQPPADSSLIVRKLEEVPMVVVATPGYLRRMGTPERIEDLAAHDCIQFLRPSSGRAVPWYLHRDGRAQEVMTSGSYSISDDIMGCITLLRAGAGLMQTLRFLVEDDLRSGALVEVMRDHAGTVRPVSLLYPDRRALPLRVRVFIDFVVERAAAWT